MNHIINTNFYMLLSKDQDFFGFFLPNSRNIGHGMREDDAGTEVSGQVG